MESKSQLGGQRGGGTKRKRSSRLQSSSKRREEKEEEASPPLSAEKNELINAAADCYQQQQCDGLPDEQQRFTTPAASDRDSLCDDYCSSIDEDSDNPHPLPVLNEVNNDDNDEDFSDLQAEFVLRDQIPHDYNSVRLLLHNLLPITPSFDVSGLAREICDEGEVGSVIKSSDLLVVDDGRNCDYSQCDALGITTIVDVSPSTHGKHPFAHQICSFVNSSVDRAFASSALTQSQCDAVKSVLEGAEGPLGLIINERLLNLPLDFVPILHESLYNELVEIQSEGILPSFSNFLMFSHVFQIEPVSVQKKTKRAKIVEEDCEFSHLEEEFYFRKAGFVVSYDIPRSHDSSTSRWTFGGNVVEKGVVLFISMSKIYEIVQDIQSCWDKKPS